MKKAIAVTLLMAALALLVGSVADLFRLRVSSGDVYPPYSSLRADPLGTRVLHDSLGELPRVYVDRNFEPLHSLEPEPVRTIILAGLPLQRLARIAADEAAALEGAVRAGSRLVIALRATAAEDAPETRREPKSADKARDEPQGDGKRQAAKKSRYRQPEYADLAERWGVKVATRRLHQPDGGAARAEGAPDSLPARLEWASDVHFIPGASAGWNVLYRRGVGRVMIERQLGKGTIVLCGDSYVVSNEALLRNRATTVLAWLVGPNRNVTFDESHLGVMADHGVSALARRYGLTGAFFTLLLLAGLFAWQRAALFVPPEPMPDDVVLTYHPAAGLQSLLHRSVAPAELVRVCVEDWRRTSTDHDRAKVDAVLRDRAGQAAHVQYNAIVEALRRARR